MNETIFGSMAVQEQRAAHAAAQQSGIRNRNELSPHAPRPDDSPILTATVELDRRIERVECVLSVPETAVIPLQLITTKWNLPNWCYQQVWQATLPPQPEGTLVRYQIKAYPVGGGETILADKGAVFSYLVMDQQPPAWIREAIVYQVFPDRFYPGDGREWNPVNHLSDIYGGTLRGIIDKLDYIADLGFNAIWLNPFLPDKTHHGYHATDYFAVNPRLGTLDDMQELVNEAHERGIHLIMDFVANHVSSEHEAFQSALADRSNPYHDWFIWEEWPHKYKSYFGVYELPELNTDYPDVRDYLFRSVRYWLGDVGFDGLRLDYALGPSLDFWTEFRAVVNELKPDTWLFGEAVTDAKGQLQFDGRFHGCFDFLLTQALRDTFAFNTMNVAVFDNFLHLHQSYFPSHFSRLSFLDNHDMDRFLWRAGENKRKLKLAALCQFTQPGPPVVYNGTEVGVTQERAIGAHNSQGMEECRQPMLWGGAQDEDLLVYYRWLIHFRRDHPAIWQGERQTVHVDAEAGTYIYALSDEVETIVVMMNVSDSPKTVSVPVASQILTVELAPWEGTAQVMSPSC